MSRNNLAELRRNAQLTQSELAKELGVSLRQYNRLEAGTSNGSIGVWRQLQQLLQAPSIDYLLEQAE